MSLVEKLPIPSSHAISELAPLEWEKLMTSKVSNFFRNLDIFVNRLLTEDPQFQGWTLINGSENKDILQSALIHQDFSKIKDDSAEYESALELLMHKNKLRHIIIKHYLDTSTREISSLKEFETAILRHYCNIAEITDEIFSQWRKNLFHSELGKKIRWMEAEGEGHGAKHIKELGLTSQYGMYVVQNDSWTECSVAEHISKEYQKLDTELGSLIYTLEQFTDSEVLPYIKYFTAMKQASSCTKLSDIDSLWAEVDIAWLGIKGRLQPVHAMEYNYIDPARIRVMPENRIIIEDESFVHVNDEAKKTQTDLIEDLKSMYSEKSSWGNSETAMRNSHVGVYVLGIYSGANLVFKFVGQSAPCRNHLRIKFGSKISLNMQSCKERFEQELKYTRAVFGEETVKHAMEKIKAEDNIGLRIAGHEVAHAAFVDDNTDSKIGFGIVPLIEEAKATWGAYATVHRRVSRNAIGPEAIEKLALLLITSNMRYLTIRGETTLAPYYNACIMELNMMLQSGLLAKNALGNFVINNERINNFYDLLRSTFDTMVRIYDEHDATLARNLLDTLGKETPEIEEMYTLAVSAK